MTPLAGTFYLAGPMSGIAHFNYPAFSIAAGMLRKRGWKIINPVDLDDEKSRRIAAGSLDGDIEAYQAKTGVSWGTIIARDLRVVAEQADGVIVLPGWERSRGARLETHLAYEMGKPILLYNGAEPYEPRWVRRAFSVAQTALTEDVALHASPRRTGVVSPTQVTIARPRREEGESEASYNDPQPAPAARSTVSTLPHLHPSPMQNPVAETRVTNPQTGGEKGTKPERFELIPPDALAEVARVYGMGAKKYSPWNWRKGYDYSLSYGALQRHLNAWWAGEDNDPESGLSHVAHAAFHCLALLTFAEEHPELDDRFKAAS